MSVNNKIIDAINFERYALALMNQLALEEQKDIFIEYELDKKYRYRVDAYAPNGIAGIEGEVVIEVKYSERGFNRSRIIDFAERLISRMPDINNILFIISFKVDNKNELISELKSKLNLNNEFNIVIWDEDELYKLAIRFPDVSVMYQETYNNKVISGALDKFSNLNYKNKNKKLISSLSNAYKRDELVLFLGAGVSVGEVKLPKELKEEQEDVGLPDWNSLIKRLIYKFFEESNKGTNKIGELDNFLENEFNDFSPIILGRFINEIFGDEFHEKLRQALYEGYNKNIREYSSVYSISKLCVPPRGRLGVSAIVTYNYDDVLEFYLNNSEVKHRSIYLEYECPASDELPIYHVHGFLPQHGEITKEMEESIVFGEHEYHLQYEKAFLWQNVTQLGILREKTALFIGLSMNDPNIRRLLDVAYNYSKSPKHYAIIRDEWVSYENQNLANIFRNMHEKTFEKLGVNIIWIKDFSEIHRVVKSIKGN